MRRFRLRLTGLSLVFLLALPTSTTYELRDFGFGSGGSALQNSANYSLTGITGEVSGPALESSLYSLGPGLEFTQQSNVPAAPTVTNPASYYNRLHVVLDTGNNPSDTLFAVAVSADSFTTTSFLQADGTVGATPIYQTYASWGGASGMDAVGLQSSTTYSFKVKAIQTMYSESAYSAVATAATTAPSLTYDIDVAAADSETAAPYVVAMGALTPGSVVTANDRIWLDVGTNAENGAVVSLLANSAGLTSASAAYTLLSASGNLASASEGFGVRVASVAQTSGGPLSAVAPYDGSNDVVGILDTTSRTIFTTSNSPIVGGRGSVLVKAKSATTTPTAADYTTTITMVASATF